MTTKTRLALAASLAALAFCGPAAAQVSRATPGQPEARTALELMPAKGKLTVTTPAFKSGEQIPFENTQYRTNTFPGLTWTAGPKGTKSYAIIMQDNSLLLRGAPILHSAYGPNYLGAAKPYTGPRTPPGPGDDYHFEVFALDTTVPEAAGSDYAGLTRAMESHILASGEVVGHGIADPNAPPPAPRPAAK